MQKINKVLKDFELKLDALQKIKDASDYAQKMALKASSNYEKSSTDPKITPDKIAKVELI